MTRSHGSLVSVISGMFLSVVLGFGSPAQSGSETTPKEGADVSNEALVKFSKEISASEIESINHRLGVEVVNRMLGGRLLQVRFPGTKSFEEIKAEYQATRGVEYVEPNRVYTIQPDAQSGDGEDVGTQGDGN
jgi:hypothetical protein